MCHSYWHVVSGCAICHSSIPRFMIYWSYGHAHTYFPNLHGNLLLWMFRSSLRSARIWSLVAGMVSMKYSRNSGVGPAWPGERSSPPLGHAAHAQTLRLTAHASGTGVMGDSDLYILLVRLLSSLSHVSWAAVCHPKQVAYIHIYTWLPKESKKGLLCIKFLIFSQSIKPPLTAGDWRLWRVPCVLHTLCVRRLVRIPGFDLLLKENNTLKKLYSLLCEIWLCTGCDIRNGHIHFDSDRSPRSQDVMRVCAGHY